MKTNKFESATVDECLEQLIVLCDYQDSNIHPLKMNVAFIRLVEIARGESKRMISSDGQVFPVEEAFEIIRAINNKKSAYLSAIEWINKQP